MKVKPVAWLAVSGTAVTRTEYSLCLLSASVYFPFCKNGSGLGSAWNQTYNFRQEDDAELLLLRNFASIKNELVWLWLQLNSGIFLV